MWGGGGIGTGSGAPAARAAHSLACWRPSWLRTSWQNHWSRCLRAGGQRCGDEDDGHSERRRTRVCRHILAQRLYPPNATKTVTNVASAKIQVTSAIIAEVGSLSALPRRRRGRGAQVGGSASSQLAPCCWAGGLVTVLSTCGALHRQEGAAKPSEGTHQQLRTCVHHPGALDYELQALQLLIRRCCIAPGRKARVWLPHAEWSHTGSKWLIPECKIGTFVLCECCCQL